MRNVNNTAPPSPLTGSTDVTLIASLPVQEIVDRYRQFFGVGVAAMFRGADVLRVYKCNETSFIFFDPPAAGDGEFYEALQRHSWYYEDEKAEFSTAAACVPNGASVLEIGCGGGSFASHIPGRKYRAIEFNDAAIARARSRGLDVRKLSIEAVAAGHEKYDVVCTFQVLEHVIDPSAFLQAMHSVLAHGGRAIIAVPDCDSVVSAPGIQQLLNLPPHHVGWWNEKSLRWVGSQKGWRVSEITRVPLRREHAIDFLEALAWAGIRHRLGKPPHPVEVPSKYAPTRVLARGLARFLQPAMRDPHLHPLGHTIIAVLDLD